jgi:hypothetical protein
VAAIRLRAQGNFTRHVLGHIPGRSKLLEQLRALDQPTDRIRSARRCNGHWLYAKIPAGANAEVLYARDADGACRPIAHCFTAANR